MHSSFPISDAEKFNLVEKAHNLIRRFISISQIIIISHYHYDHFYHKDLDVYRGKTILAKNPNEFINESQRERAIWFFSELFQSLSGNKLVLSERREDILVEDPLKELKIAMSKDFGEYTSRRKELLEKGRRWFSRLVEKWKSWKIIPSGDYNKCEVNFIDGRTFTYGNTVIRFGKPWFHGMEYSRLGWIIPIVIKKGSVKLLYTSDVNGPIIEDYAEYIIKKNPDVLFIDGPATYMIPYTINLINFRRALENIKRIIKETKTKIIFIDHHLTRDPKYMIRLKEIYSSEKKPLTFAEFHKYKPIAYKIYEERFEKR